MKMYTVFITLSAMLLICSCGISSERDAAYRPDPSGSSKPNGDTIATHAELQSKDEYQPDLFNISDAVYDRYSEFGYRQLAQPERVFFCIWDLQAEVNNGGFDQYYFNSSGAHALDAVESLKAIGADYTADLVRQANALFGRNGPSSDRLTRINQLDSLPQNARQQFDSIDQDFYRYIDDLEKMLTAYMRNNREVFREN